MAHEVRDEATDGRELTFKNGKPIHDDGDDAEQ